MFDIKEFQIGQCTVKQLINIRERHECNIIIHAIANSTVVKDNLLLTGLSNFFSPYIIDTFDVLIRSPNLGKACMSSYSEEKLSTLRLPFTHQPVQILLGKMWTQFDLNLDYEPLKVEQPPKLSLVDISPGTKAY